jgi:glutamyl-tRNA synthetase
MTEVRTRFAPSPTGYLHIGGVRTALFCWLFARRHGGKFILRIDDTDQQRNVEEALAPILNGLKWLGIDWDEGPGVDGPFAPYYQSQRTEAYQKAAEALIEKGAAYYDYARPEEIQAEREAARNEKRSFVYSRKWMAETPEQRKRFEDEGRSAVVRLKMPREGSLEWVDLVRGEVTFDWSQEQDHVIQRADGSCLYHLASVVDDHQFEISHVIRAEEHLSNTPRQVFIAKSLGYPLPQYAHLPVVAEPGSKVKLSKRKLKKYLKNKDFKALLDHGQQIAERLGLEVDTEQFNPVIVDFYREVGYLPEALVNYLALLGWSLDDKTEFFHPRELIDAFSLERINKASASFDPQKLQTFQLRHMNERSLEEKYALVLPYLQRARCVDPQPSPLEEKRIGQLITFAGDRLKVAGDILDYQDFFLPDDRLRYDEKALEKRLRKPEEAPGLLKEYRDALADVEPFEAGPLEEHMKTFLEEKQIKAGQIIHAVRVATTGKPVGLGMFETLEILGRDQVLARIDHTLEILN